MEPINQIQEEVFPEIIEENEIKPTTNTNPNFSNPQSSRMSTDIHGVNIYKLIDNGYYGRGLFSCNPKEPTAILVSRGELLFEERVSRSYYLNFLQPYIDSKYKPAYNEEPPVTEVFVGSSDVPVNSHFYLDWVKNVDGAGLTSSQANMNILQSAYSNAVAFAVMDKPKSGGAGATPVEYVQPASTVDPTTVSVDRYGRLEKIGFIGIVNNADKTYYERTTWTNTDVTIEKSDKLDADYSKTKWVLVENTKLSIDEMPILPLFTVQRSNPRDYLPDPVEVRAILYGCSCLFNIMSERIWHIVRQSLAHIFTTGEFASLRDGNTAVIKLTDRGDGVTPQIGYINADTGIAKNHKELEDDMIQKVIDKMAEGGVIVTRGDMVVPESGVARGYRYRAQNTVLGETVRLSRIIDDWREKFFKKYQGSDGWESKTRYKTDYTINESIPMLEHRENIDLYKRLGLIELIRETMKEMASRTIKDPDRLRRINQEIEKMKTVPDGNGLDTFNE